MTTTIQRPEDPATGPPTPAWVPPAPGEPPRERLVRFWRGSERDPRWVRPALLGLLLATAVLYIWGLGASGWANAFYSAAAQAGSVSWKAFFFGSSDAGNSITVDKTPASLWVMALSARMFGVNAWSILVPQALMGVASVGLLYATVRRWFGAGAGLLAGAVLALTPVAVLMFRFNNPDALLVLLLVAGAWATLRAVETASTRWLLLAGTFVGFGFLAKMLQALLVVPAFALVYLVAAGSDPSGRGRPPLRRRILQLLAAGGALVVSAGWYILLVELIPASWRPYIGGSQNNSILELTLGYNGLGRLSGNETGSVGGGPGGPGGGGWGETGWARLFNPEMGGQIAWLLPAALLLLGIGLFATWRAPRTDMPRASFIVWGGWLLVTGLVFSFMRGIFHAYYNVALAPAIAALVGMGVATLWQRRAEPWATSALAVVLIVTAVWSSSLLGRSAEFASWLRPLIVVAGLGAAAFLIMRPRVGARVATPVVAAGLVAALAGPAAYSLQTAATPHEGAIPTAGPAVAGAGFGPGGGGPGGFTRRNFGGPGQGQGNQGPFGGQSPFGGQGGFPGGGFPGPGQGGFPVGGPGGAGGLLDGSQASAELVALLKQDAGSYTWAAATVGSNNAAGYQLASGQAVMPVGGFNGTDPSPTLEQFQQDVAAGRIHWFIAAGIGMRGDSGSQTSQEIAAWVAQNFEAQSAGGTTVYDLSQGAPGTTRA
jgi:4-amino-4-deoxy-L-arabinose transferase-like glycosyltransferase